MAALNAGPAASGGPNPHDDNRRKPPKQPYGLTDRLRGRVSQELNAQKDRMTEALDDAASRVRRAGEPLREEPYAPLAEYTEGAASRLERFASELRARDVEELAHEVGEFARRRPGIFVGASLAAGILAARFLKSSTGESGSPYEGPGTRE